MSGPERGIYEVLITEALATSLRDLEDHLDPKQSPLRPAEAADRVALHLGGVAPVAPGAVLRAIAALRPEGSAERIDKPLIPLLDTTVLTNAPGEPRIGCLPLELHLR